MPPKTAARSIRLPPGRILAVLATLGALAAGGGPARAFDLALYEDVLAHYTRPVPDLAGVRVDYRSLAAAPKWRALMASLREAEPSRLATRDERLAFWINAYNALAIDLVVRHYPVESIRDLGSLFRPVWRRSAGVIDGRPVSLHEIEHRILRPMGEPRIHGALVCASLSCPPLRREPYRAAGLPEQLDGNVRRWLGDPRKGARLDRTTRTLHLSRVFDWFEEDFAPAGGVVAFVAQYLPPAEAAFLRANRDEIEVRFLPYDWRLNDLATAPGAEEEDASGPRSRGSGEGSRRASSRSRSTAG